MDLEKSLDQLAEAITAKAASATPPSRQIADPTRNPARGVTAGKVFQRDKSGRLLGYTETTAAGERVEQVFERDKSGRIAKITTVPAGASAPGAAFKSRGGFLPPALPEPAYSRMMKAMHAEAWTAFVRKHAR